MSMPAPWIQTRVPNRELNETCPNYAIRVRELSDAAATLGRRIAAGEQIERNIRAVKQLRALADQAREDLLGALESFKSRNSAAAG